MTIAEPLLPEFDPDMATTRRLLERVQADNGTWESPQKSFSLAHLAQLVAWMPGWITNAVKETELNLAAAAKYSNQKTEDLVKMFDTNVKEARAAIASSKDADYKVKWSLKFGERVVMTPRRGGIVRQHMN